MSESTRTSTTSEVERHNYWAVTSGASSGDVYAASIATVGSRATGVSTPSNRRSGKHVSPQLRVSPLARQQCNTLLSASIDDLQRALDNDEDFALRNNAIEQVKERLARLWNIRKTA